MTLTHPDSLPSRPVDMLLRFSCPMCSTVLEIPRARTGLEGPCPVCGATIVAPSVVISASQTPDVQMMNVAVTDQTTAKEEPQPPVAESGSSTEHQATRLCDLPPRPAFSAREAGNLPSAKPPKMERRRRKRSVVSMKESTGLELLRRDFWMILLVLVVLAVGAAFALYGDAMFRGFESAPQMQR